MCMGKLWYTLSNVAPLVCEPKGIKQFFYVGMSPLKAVSPNSENEIHAIFEL